MEIVQGQPGTKTSEVPRSFVMKRGKLCDSDQVAFAVLQAAQSGKDCSTVFDLIETWPFTTMVGAMSSFVQMASPASGMWGTCVLAEAMKAANKKSTGLKAWMEM